MAQYPFNWPGVPGGPIIFDFKVTAMVPPAWRTNVRPGITARLPRLGIQHENGNPNAMAIADSRYLFNGAGGRTASWHATVDHIEAFANLMATEVGWQASDGSGPGNMQGFAIELSQWPMVHGTPADWREARRKAAQIGGRVGARLNIQPPSKRHRDFAPDNKNCPQYLNGNATWWREYVDDYLHYYNDEKKRMGGTPHVSLVLAVGAQAVTTASLNVRSKPGTANQLWATLPSGQSVTIIGGPQTDAAHRWWRVEWTERGTAKSGWAAADWLQATKAAPSAPPKDTGPKKGDRVRVTAGLYVRQGWGTTSRVMALLNQGVEANVIDGPQHADGYRWVDIKGDFGSGWVADAWLQVIGEAKEDPKPSYAKVMPIKELLDTNLNYDEIAEGISTVNEIEFVYTANLLEIRTKTPALQYASPGSPEVREPYNVGEHVIEAWRMKNHEGIWYSLLTGPGDEWVRIRSDHAVVISGSPLLGDDLV